MENNSENIFGKLPKEYLGLLFAAGGLLILIGAWLNWEWILEGDGSMINIAWISNKFGRTVARIIMGTGGVFLFIVGIILFVLMKP